MKSNYNDDDDDWGNETNDRNNYDLIVLFHLLPPSLSIKTPLRKRESAVLLDVNNNNKSIVSPLLLISAAYSHYCIR
jgi:hypothetical protein